MKTIRYAPLPQIEMFPELELRVAPKGDVWVVTEHCSVLAYCRTENEAKAKLAEIAQDRWKAYTSPAHQSILAKQRRRAVFEADLSTRIQALPGKRYGVIYADPPWRFEPYSRVTGMDRAADNHYPTCTLAEIKAFDVPGIAAKDSVLFLWATVPMRPQAEEVLSAWGYKYKSDFVWIKDRIGTGFWSRNKREHLLIGTRGKIPAPAPGTQWPSAIEAPVGRHSEKPAIFYELIEAYYPTLPKVELFARAARPGWSCWGPEAPAASDLAAE
jgi:N6-adenosine-specific RNA methylase IME4